MTPFMDKTKEIFHLKNFTLLGWVKNTWTSIDIVRVVIRADREKLALGHNTDSEGK
jgi:hypothetical protein